MGGDVTYSVPGQPSLLTQHPPDPLVQYTSPNGACQIVETPPVPPKGIFHFRTPDGSYNVRAQSIKAKDRKLKVGAEHSRSSPW